MNESSGIQVPLPPPDAKIYTTVCDYCPVGCGYKVFVWPVGREGGPRASENVLGADFPAGPLTGKWISSNMHNIIMLKGSPHNVIVLPDSDAKVVNIGGNHSVRGGTLALKLYTPNSPTADRLKWPLLRINGSLQPIPWDIAVKIIAETSKYVIKKYGPLAWGMKTYGYGFFENTYAIGKLVFEKIGTPSMTEHHAPAWGDDTPGLTAAGIDPFGASFEDFKNTDVILVCGADPYETRTVLFTSWIAPGGAKIIHVDPRKTFISNYAAKNGGLHLQLKIGTDTLLYNSIAREIIQQGLEDSDFIKNHTASRDEINGDKAWRRRMFGLTFDELKRFLLMNDAFKPEVAEVITNVPASLIRKTAEMLARPKENSERPKVVIAFEKGVYWTHNFENTAALANLALLIGSAGRPGRLITRFGGHQRGGMFAGSYPLDKSLEEFEGNKIEMNQDRWTIEGHTRFMWVIGVDWAGATGASQFLRDTLRKLVLKTEPQTITSEPDLVIAQFKARIDNGGMVLVQQEIYLNDTSEFADFVLPAATWGEEDFTRANAERRLRLYSGFNEPPGEAKPDWQIVAAVARAMGFDGFDWKDSNEIFEEAAERSRGGILDYTALTETAKRLDKRAHEFLRELGTTGIQLPAKLQGDELVGTARLHSDLTFKTSSKKAMFVMADWGAVEERMKLLKPKGDEVWVTNMRVNHIWQTAFDDMRKPYVIQRYPMNIIEINPDDASAWGIKSGDLVSIESDDVLTQIGTKSSGVFTAAAYVTDQVPRGLACSHFHWPKSPANSVVPANTKLQPLNQRYQFKLGKGRVRKIGETTLAKTVPFTPRNIA